MEWKTTVHIDVPDIGDGTYSLAIIVKLKDGQIIEERDLSIFKIQ